MMNEHWKKSTYSNGNGGQCVEARATAQGAAVRDTQHRGLAELHLPCGEWNALLGALRTR
ncbi:DUF397 domain-containing protein [Nocardiopsis alba]|uniref:DUF397 domain-containing protein n=1 Tax=Nocardiopsis alba TaxID=53437 RepID=UPI000349A39A|nr:DUF397 domain-containing protein [Nocardiopsis alba]